MIINHNIINHKQKLSKNQQNDSKLTILHYTDWPWRSVLSDGLGGIPSFAFVPHYKKLSLLSQPDLRGIG